MPFTACSNEIMNVLDLRGISVYIQCIPGFIDMFNVHVSGWYLRKYLSMHLPVLWEYIILNVFGINLVFGFNLFLSM